MLKIKICMSVSARALVALTAYWSSASMKCNLILYCEAESTQPNDIYVERKRCEWNDWDCVFETSRVDILFMLKSIYFSLFRHAPFQSRTDAFPSRKGKKHWRKLLRETKLELRGIKFDTINQWQYAVEMARNLGKMMCGFASVCIFEREREVPVVMDEIFWT